MTTIQIEAPGLLTTVQDLGREGFGPIGVSASGAADPISLRVGNRLAGNADDAAALEMTLTGGSFLFPEGAVAALTGSDFSATLAGTPVDLWLSFKISPGQTLTLGATRGGARCYLCVRGGIAVKLFLGSASTHILSGLGGFQDRPLRKGDVLSIGPASSSFCRAEVAFAVLRRISPRKKLRVTVGPQSDWFPTASQQAFYGATYKVAEESNRMGLRLQGPPVHGDPGKAMITEGASLGAVQITDEGLPIILFVEQQTTGGYPKIANVISADMPSVGQLRPRDEVRFERVSREVARAALIDMEELLKSDHLIRQ